MDFLKDSSSFLQCLSLLPPLLSALSFYACRSPKRTLSLRDHKKYEEEGKPVSMLADYTKMMTQYSEFAAAMAEYESEELSDADAAYLIQVNARVQAKLLTLN